MKTMFRSFWPCALLATATILSSASYALDRAEAFSGQPQAGYLSNEANEATALAETPFDPLLASPGVYSQAADDADSFVMLSGCDECCDCGQVACDCGTACCLPWWAHRSSVWGEFLYLHPTDADVTHAQQQNGIGGAGTVPFGVIGRVDPHYEPAFRLGANKAFNNCASLGVSYTFFESNAHDGLVAPVVPGGGGAVGSLVHHPGAGLTASAGPVNAEYAIRYQLADIAFSSLWKGNDRFFINWSLGARYGHLEQDFLQTGTFGGGLGGAVLTRTDINFDGGGVLLGLNGERRLGCSCFSLYGKTAVAPMSGSFRGEYVMNNQTSQTLLANAIWKDDRFVTLLDYEFGLAWTSPCCTWRLSSGYMATHWFNAVTTDTFIAGVQQDDYVDIEGDLSFSGFTTRVERRW